MVPMMVCGCGEGLGGIGEILDVGRQTRTIPPAIRRALEARDGVNKKVSSTIPLEVPPPSFQAI